MKIIYLHQYFKTPDMAGGTRSYEMARRLVALGHEVHMVTARDDGSLTEKGWVREDVEGIHVHWFPVAYSNKMGFTARIKAFLSFAWHAARKAASLRGDVIFASSTPLTIALPAAYSAWRQRIPMVFEVRDLWPTVPIALGILKHPLLVALAKWLEKFAYQRSARVVALAPGMADGVVDAGYDARRIAVIPNGCDLALFGNQQLVDDSKQYTVLYIGTIGPANGVEYIPRLAAVLQAEHPGVPVRFNIIGDGKSLERVRQVSRDLGVLDQSVFLLGTKPKREIPFWTAGCAATIMTYDGPEVLYRDSVSNKFFDSMAAGKPVIANFSGFSTLVARSVGAGIIVSKEDLHDAARVLVGALTDDTFMTSAPDACMKLAKTQFDRDILARSLETVLQQAVDDPEGVATGEPIGWQFRELWEQSKGYVDAEASA